MTETVDVSIIMKQRLRFREATVKDVKVRTVND